jgi:S-methylmethionine-dependent homocysteine/selenocysteine methylase
MSKYRKHLPQLQNKLFLSDGGLETTLIYHENVDLPLFAAFDLLKDEAGTEALRGYYEPYLELAAERGLGFVLESPTWRANPRWAAKIGYSVDELEDFNRRAIALMEEIRDANADGLGGPVIISGFLGPHDDGYQPDEHLDADGAQEYHSTQIGTFAATAADLVTAVTMTYAEEAIGVTRAAAAAGIPAVISFTVETDGRLPSGQPLGEAIYQVDVATGSGPAAYFMINCAHPTHFEGVLEGDWVGRIRGLRANASTCTHAELDEAEELDDGDPADLGARYAGLRSRLPRLNVLGGCCGTDHRHVAEIRDAWLGT